MLVLTRKQRQQITIGENITITVLRVKGQAVRIGIEAPDGVRILRAELTVEEDPSAEKEATSAEASTAASGTQRSTQNARRSRLGMESDSRASRMEAHPSRERKSPTDVLPLETSAMRMTPVSLLSFR